MPNLKSLLKNKQKIRIDNHLRGIPIKWDWNPNDFAQDVHLDKTSNTQINGKEVTIKVTLNKDG